MPGRPASRISRIARSKSAGGGRGLRTWFPRAKPRLFSESAFPKKLLVETSIENLLLAGVYAVSELFLGGVPTALHTGLLAADLILERGGSG